MGPLEFDQDRQCIYCNRFHCKRCTAGKRLGICAECCRFFAEAPRAFVDADPTKDLSRALSKMWAIKQDNKVS